MSELSEQWTIGDLKDRVQIPFADPAGMRPSFRFVRLEVVPPESDSLLADIDISSADRTERWRLTFDAMWSELREMPLDAATIVLRANVEEWWDMRDREPPASYLTVRRLG